MANSSRRSASQATGAVSTGSSRPLSVTVVSVLIAVTVGIMLRTVKMMTVCSVREQPEVRACGTRIAAMFDSATSRTVAEPPRVVGQKRCTW